MKKTKIDVFALSLIIICQVSFGQEIVNLHQIFNAPGVALYDCAASPFGEYVSFRQSSRKNDSHWVLHLSSQKLIPILESSDDLFGETNSNTQNLLWSREDARVLRIKVLGNAASIHEIAFKSSGKIKDSQLDLNLDANQLLTCTQLCWSSSGNLLLSLCKSGIPITSDIDAENYDVYNLGSTWDEPQNASRDSEVREMSASPIGRREFIISGVGKNGNIDLYMTRRSKGLIQKTHTKAISENWPVVSPNQKWVAFCDAGKGIDNLADLYVINLEEEGSIPQKLVEGIYIPSTGVSEEGVYQWSQDSQGLYFIKKDQSLKNPISFVDIVSLQWNHLESDLAFVSSFVITDNEKKVFAIAAGSATSEDRISYKAFLGDLKH